MIEPGLIGVFSCSLFRYWVWLRVWTKWIYEAFRFHVSHHLRTHPGRHVFHHRDSQLPAHDAAVLWLWASAGSDQNRFMDPGYPCAVPLILKVLPIMLASFSCPFHTIVLPLFMPPSGPFDTLSMALTRLFHSLFIPFELRSFSLPLHTFFISFSYLFCVFSYPFHSLFIRCSYLFHTLFIPNLSNGGQISAETLWECSIVWFWYSSRQSSFLVEEFSRANIKDIQRVSRS